MKLQAKALSIQHITNFAETLEDAGKLPHHNNVWDIKCC